jgi:hypothetical protein
LRLDHGTYEPYQRKQKDKSQQVTHGMLLGVLLATYLFSNKMKSLARL